jgi:hypothetical protein
MGEARLAWPPARGVSCHSRRADLRARDADETSRRRLQAGEAVSPRELYGLARREGRQEAWQTATEERLSGAGRPDEEDQ